MALDINPVLKPLIANLKRLEIGEYLHTKEFSLFMLGSGMDAPWEAAQRDAGSKKRIYMPGHHDAGEDEDALAHIIDSWYAQQPNTLGKFVLPVLINFARWNSVKLNYADVLNSLETLGIDEAALEAFISKYQEIQETKPFEIQNEKIELEVGTAPIAVSSNKIFVVHGHDDKSRLEICNLLRDDLKLEPVVLQEAPNKSIETIIGKFERLASECSAAIILFTPDDVAGDNMRARQNVIMELGYFLGKFQGDEDRKIIILKKGNVEIPSDIAGVLYLDYTRAVKEIYYDLKKQFEHWGYTV